MQYLDLKKKVTNRSFFRWCFLAVPLMFFAVPSWAEAVDDSDGGFRNTDELVIPHDDNAGIMHYDVQAVPHAPRLPEKITTSQAAAKKHVKSHGRHVASDKKRAQHTTPKKAGAQKSTAPAKVRKVSMLSGHPLPGTYGKYHVAGPKAYPYKHYPFGKPNTRPKGSGQRF